MGDDWFLNRKGWKRQTRDCMSDDQQDLAGHLTCIARQTVSIHRIHRLCTEFSQLYHKWNLCTSRPTVEGSSLYWYYWHVNNGKVSENMHTISNKQLRLPKPTAWNVVMNCQEMNRLFGSIRDLYGMFSHYPLKHTGTFSWTYALRNLTQVEAEARSVAQI